MTLGPIYRVTLHTGDKHDFTLERHALQAFAANVRGGRACTVNRLFKDDDGYAENVEIAKFPGLD